MKKLIKRKYEKPTPVNLQKLGDSFLVASIAAAASPVITGCPIIGSVFAAVGILGKILTDYPWD